MAREQTQSDVSEVAGQLPVFPIQLDPQSLSVLEQRIAVPYTTTQPSFTPRVNGIRRIYNDGTNYWYYVYANGAWRSQQLGVSASSAIVGRSVPASTQSITSAAGDTKVTLGTNTFAVGITWDSTNNRFTVVTAGYYLVYGSVRYGTTVDAAWYRGTIYKNGSISSNAVSQKVSGGTNQVTSEVMDVLSLAVNDYIELFTAVSSDATLSAAVLTVQKIN